MLVYIGWCFLLCYLLFCSYLSVVFYNMEYEKLFDLFEKTGNMKGNSDVEALDHLMEYKLVYSIAIFLFFVPILVFVFTCLFLKNCYNKFRKRS